MLISNSHTCTWSDPGTHNVSFDWAGDSFGGVVGVVEGDPCAEESSISEHWGLVGVGIDCDLPEPPIKQW